MNYEIGTNPLFTLLNQSIARLRPTKTKSLIITLLCRGDGHSAFSPAAGRRAFTAKPRRKNLLPPAGGHI